MDNNKYHTRDVKKVCENKLNIEFRSGKEYNGWYFFNDKKVARITIAKGRKPIPPKTYKTMATQLKLLVNQFDELLECPLDKKRYDKILKSKIKV